MLSIGAKNFGNPELYTVLPTSGFNWKLYTVNNIQVVNGTAEIYLWSDAPSSGSGLWVGLDDVQFIRQT
jgi:hypothetical protein